MVSSPFDYLGFLMDYFLPLLAISISIWMYIIQQARKVDLKFSYHTFEAESSYNTQFAFFNKGTISASNLKIEIPYPADTEIIRISPPMKYHHSQDNSTKIVELQIQRLTPGEPFGIIILSENEPSGPPKIHYHEEKAVQQVSSAHTNQ